MTEYLVFCSERGWWGRGGNYVSLIKDAKHFTREEAIAFCRSRFEPAVDGQTHYVPVSVSDLMEVTSK